MVFKGKDIEVLRMLWQLHDSVTVNKNDLSEYF